MAGVAAQLADQRRRRDVPEPDLFEVVRRVSTSCIRTSGSTTSRLDPAAASGRSRADGVLRRDRRPDDQRAAAGGAGRRSCTCRPFSVPCVPVYNMPGRERRAEVHRGRARRHLPRQDHQVERPGASSKLNPGVKLPGTDITVVHRSDGSGTTYIWVDYLAKVSPEWKKQRRRRHLGELAGRPRRQGQRGRLRSGARRRRARSATSS